MSERASENESKEASERAKGKLAVADLYFDRGDQRFFIDIRH